MSLTWQQSIGIDDKHLCQIEQNIGSSVLIHTNIKQDLEKLLLAAKTDGIEISIISSYRSFERQLTLWNDKWQGYRPVYSRHGRPLNIAQMSDMEKYKAISLWSALPGLSRHHWGTDLDIFSAKAIKNGHKVELVPDEFESKGVCDELNRWLDEHLTEYGFFRPYKIYKQGVSAEAWHISHQTTSQNIQSSYPFEQTLAYLNQSEIKSRVFICDIFEHYCEQYFLNICQ